MEQAQEAAARPKTISIAFAGINYPGGNFGFPYEVNQSYTLNFNNHSKRYEFTGEPDLNGIYPVLSASYSNREWNVGYDLYKAAGVVESDVFYGLGLSPVSNEVVKNGVAYGGTATI